MRLWRNPVPTYVLIDTDGFDELDENMDRGFQVQLLGDKDG